MATKEVLQGPVLGEILFSVIISSLDTQSRSMLIIVTGYTKLRAIICTKIRASPGSSCGTSRATVIVLALMQGLALTDC